MSYYKLLAGESWDINFVPYELLSIEKKSSEYLQNVFKLNSEQLSSSNINQNDWVNANRSFRSNKSQFKNYTKVNQYTFFGKIGFRMQSGQSHNIIIARTEKSYIEYYVYKLIFLSGSLLIKIDKLFSKISKVKIDYPDKYNKVFKIIMEKYKDDNQKLKLVLAKYDLDKYGY